VQVASGSSLHSSRQQQQHGTPPIAGTRSRCVNWHNRTFLADC
jgi:hypothetical protein